ncbi:hypothetical protein K438DRAFT_1968813 [Mycena galopus ATCC 62051]|nr:hypothetical protein K438DRAFT_1968813 [Mycena galopus ATCC 62051]
MHSTPEICMEHTGGAEVAQGKKFPNDADSSGRTHVAPLDAQLDITAADLHPEARSALKFQCSCSRLVRKHRPEETQSLCAATPLFIPSTPYRFDEPARGLPNDDGPRNKRMSPTSTTPIPPASCSLSSRLSTNQIIDLPISTQGHAVDERDLPVLPHTWARPLEGDHHTGGKLVLVISSRRYLYVPANKHNNEEFTRYHQCASSPLGYNLIRGPDEPPYLSSPHLICLPTTWNTPALVTGDRVAVVDGEFASGYVVDLCKEGAGLCVRLVRAQWDPISPLGVFTAKMQDVQHHALDHPFEGFMVKDRVLVLLRILYRDTMGADLRAKDFVILNFLPGGLVVLYNADYHDIDQEFNEQYLAQVPIADLVWDSKWHIDPIADQIFHCDPNTAAPIRRPRNMLQEEFRMKLAAPRKSNLTPPLVPATFYPGNDAETGPGRSRWLQLQIRTSNAYLCSPAATSCVSEGWSLAAATPNALNALKPTHQRSLPTAYHRR